MGKEYSTNREYLEDIALREEVKSFNFEGEDRINRKLGCTLAEAGKHKNFWNSLFHEFKDEIEKIEFLYQERKKELPLSGIGRLGKKLGFKVEPKIQDGDVKKTQVHPITINKNFPTLNINTSKEEWESLNALWREGSKGFEAPYIMTLEPLCYRVNLPLENIAEVKFKDGGFLNKQYQKKQNVS